MMEITNIIAGFIGLSFIVLIHELGHLIMARYMGIEVEVFSVGFGHVLFQHKTSKTEYRFSLIPFGGYCKMKGSSALLTKERTTEAIEHEAGDFYAASPLKRIATSLAGPFANLILSFVIFFIITLIGKEYPYFENRIVLFQEIFPNEAESSQPAIKAGLQTGDIIYAINETETPHFTDISSITTTSADIPLDLVVKRGNQTITTTVVPKRIDSNGQGQIGLLPWLDAEIASVTEGSAADAALLRSGDSIIEIDGKSINNAWDIIRVANQSTNQTLSLLASRGGKENMHRLVLPSNTITSFNELGIHVKQPTYIKHSNNIFSAVGQATSDIAYLLSASVGSIASIIKGTDISKVFAGPIRITYFTGQTLSGDISNSWKNRIVNYVNFLGIISIAILFMNLLPIPVTDGGQTVLFLYEMILRKMPSRKLIYYYQITGGIMIFALIIVVVWGDIVFLVQGS